MPEPEPRPRMPHQLVTINGARHAEREALRASAWQLRVEGKSQTAIAAELEVSVSTVAAYLRETLEELKSSAIQSAETWRALQLARLDGIVGVWSQVAQNPDHPEGSRAAVIVVRAIESQSRLLGLLQSNLVLPGTDRAPESMEEQLARSPALRAAVRRQLDQADELARTHSPAVQKSPVC